MSETHIGVLTERDARHDDVYFEVKTTRRTAPGLWLPKQRWELMGRPTRVRISVEALDGRLVDGKPTV